MIPEEIQAIVTADEERLFAPWLVGRPEGYRADTATKTMVCLGYWLREELTKLGLSDDDRRIQESAFHRWSRSREDLFVLAAEIINDAIEGKIDRNRRPLRRWG
jgi:hypothetical protein